MSSIDHTRHSGIFNASEQFVTLIGAGGIGAFTALVLGKMGVGNLTIIDDDKIEEVNIATQFLSFLDEGAYKADAVKDMVNDTFGGSATSKIMRVTKDTDPVEIQNPIIISGVDSIDARKDIWYVVRKTGADWYLDARMSAEKFYLYSVKLDNADWYDEYLESVNEEDVPDIPCTEKATIYTGATAAGHIGAAVRRIITGLPQPVLVVHDILENALQKV